MSNLEQKLEQKTPWKKGNGIYPYYLLDKENKNAIEVVFGLRGFPGINEVNEEYDYLIKTVKEKIKNICEKKYDLSFESDVCTLDDLNRDILNEDLSDYTMTSVSKKLLKIELLKNTLKIEHEGYPQSLFLKSNLIKAEQELKKIDFEKINPFSLMSAKKLFISPYHQLNLSSMSQLFSCVTESNGFPVYEKHKMFAYLNGDVASQKNDLNIEYPGRDTDDFFDDGEMLTFRSKFKSGLEKIVEKRIELLNETNCFLKPKHGACGDYVTHISYKDGIIRLKSKTNYTKLVDFLTHPDVRRTIVDKNFEGLEVDEADDFDDGDRVYLTINNEEYAIDFCPYGDKEASTIHHLGENYYTLSPFSVEFLKDCKFKRIDDEDNYIYEIEVDNLPNFLNGFEAMMLDIGKPTYMEEEIKIPKIEGKTWEIRQISIAKNFNEEPEHLVNYVKMGGNDYLGGLSKGGHGRDSRKTVFEAYKQIRPNDPQEHLFILTEEYLMDMEEKSEMVAYLLGQYMTGVCKEKLPDFPFGKINCDMLSTDYMAEIVEKDGQKFLNPVLIDINFYFGYEGLKDFDELSYNMVSFCKGQLLYQGKEKFNDAKFA